jgi:hypothetical protein
MQFMLVFLTVEPQQCIALVKKKVVNTILETSHETEES